jgi:hypothetical protein
LKTAAVGAELLDGFLRRDGPPAAMVCVALSTVFTMVVDGSSGRRLRAEDEAATMAIGIRT